MQSSSRALVITGAVTGALLLAFGGYELLKPKPAAGGGNGTTTANLVQGHYYTIAFTCPSTTSTPSIAALAGVTLVSQAPNGAGTGGSIVIYYTGTSGSYPITNNGCSITVTDNGTAAPPPPVSGTLQNQAGLPANAAGPYTLQAPTAGAYKLINGNVYLIEAPPIAGQTLAQTVDALAALYPNLKGAAGTWEKSSWDMGQVPSGWPDSDATVRRIAVLVSFANANPYVLPRVSFPAPATTKVWLATG